MSPDALTGLPSRGAFANRLAELGECSAVLFDIDHLVYVSMAFGHLVSDEVLVAVAGVFTDAARLHDGSAYRIGGDEFTVLLPHADHAAALGFAHEAAAKISAQRLAPGASSDPRRPHVVVNAMVCRLSSTCDAAPTALLERFAEAVWEQRKRDRDAIGFVIDARPEAIDAGAVRR